MRFQRPRGPTISEGTARVINSQLTGFQSLEKPRAARWLQKVFGYSRESVYLYKDGVHRILRFLAGRNDDGERRAVGADGSLTGYAAGLDRKRRLLQLENIL